MPISRRRVEIAVGVFMLFGMATMLVSVVIIGQWQRSWEERVRVVTTFQSVEGLQPGAPVYLAGILVGSVEDVALNAAGDVRVVLEVRAEDFHRIRQDSRARIKTSGLVGDRYIDITVGSADSPAVQPGEVIPGTAPLDMSEVLADAQPMIENLTVAIENVRAVTERLLAKDSDVNVTLNNLRRITTKMAEGEGTVGLLLNDDALYQDMRETAAGARAIVTNAERITAALRDQGPELMAHTRDAVGSIGAAADRVQELMEQGLKDLPAIMAGLERSVGALEEVLANLSAASEDIRAATPQLPRIVAEGQAAVDESRAVLRAARAHPLLRRYFQEQRAETAPILVQDRAEVSHAP